MTTPNLTAPPADHASLDPIFHAWFAYRAETLAMKRVAHELSNSLTGLVVALEIVASAGSGPPDAGSLETARSSAARAVAASHQLRRFLNRPGEPGLLELGVLVKKAMQAVAGECPSFVRVCPEVGDGKECYVRGSDRELLALFIHLLLDAIGSMTRAGDILVQVRLVTLCAAQIPATCQPGEFAEVTILAKPGVAPVIPSRMPESTFLSQDDAAGQRLRLSIARQIVTRFGGWIDVATEGPLARRVQVCLPRCLVIDAG